MRCLRARSKAVRPRRHASSSEAPRCRYKQNLGITSAGRAPRQTWRAEPGGSCRPSRLSQRIRKHAVQRLRSLRKIDGADEEACVPGLAAALRSDKAAELLFRCALTMGGHLLERAERSESPSPSITRSTAPGPSARNEFVFEINDAHLYVQVGDSSRPRRAGRSRDSRSSHITASLKTATNRSTRPQVRHATHRHDVDALSSEIAPLPSRERLQCDPIAVAFHEYHGALFHR